MKKFKIKQEYLLTGLAFVSGMSLMVFELVAARLLAPTVGSSIYVWTSVIGVIIAALSVGVWAGGRVADIRGRLSDISYLLLFVSLSMVIVVHLSSTLLAWLALTDLDLRFKGVVASFSLFAVTSLLIGLIGPYLAKLNVRSLAHTGRSIANLDAMNALGGIFGTFLTGFVLFALLGAKSILIVMAVLLVGFSWLIEPAKDWHLRAALTVVVLLLSGLYFFPRDSSVVHIDTPTAHYVITDERISGKDVRLIATGPGGFQSGVELGSGDELFFWYTKEIARVVEVAPKKDDILILGGGTYTMPEYFASKYLQSKVDVVEIDPELQAVAGKYFFYNAPRNVRDINDDARTYINNTERRYDVVVVDIYNDSEIPFTLLTREYSAAMRRIVNPGGVVVVNIIANDKGSCRDFWEASTSPYAQKFKFGVFKKRFDTEKKTNTIAVFSDNSLLLGADYRQVDTSKEVIYSDDFSPAEALQRKCS